MSKKSSEKIKSISQIDMPLLITVLMLLSIGIVMVLSASAPSALATYNDSYHYVKTQGIAAILGLIVMGILSKWDYRKLKKWYKVIYVFGILILFTVLIPSIGVESKGATRWIKVFGIQLQPSEITKICLIIFYAGYFTDKNNDTTGFYKLYLLPLLLFSFPILILYKVQNHLSAGILMLIIAFSIMLMAGCPMKYILSTIALAGGAFIVGLMFFREKITSGFRSDRIEAWLHTEENARGTGYQTLQSLYAIGSGGLFRSWTW